MPKNGDLLIKEYASSLEHRRVRNLTCGVGADLPAGPDTAPGERTNNKLSYGLIPRKKRGYDYGINEYQP